MIKQSIAVAMALAGVFGTFPAQAQLAPLPMRELQVLALVFGMLHKDLAIERTDPQLVLDAVRGMVRSADPEGGEFFGEEEMRQMRSREVKAHVGLVLAPRDQDVVVTAPIAGGPAEIAGLRQGDVIVRVDDKSTRGWSQTEVERALEGVAGSAVAITVRRGADSRLFEMRRVMVSAPGATLTRIEPQIAWLRIPSMREDTLKEMASLIQIDWARGEPKAMILDLRGNGGGLLSAAAGVAAAFLPPESVLSIQKGRPESPAVSVKADRSSYAPTGPDVLAGLPAGVKSIPLIVLVDGGTSAGSELVAAALRDHGRAMLVGQRTFGRASIQTVKPLGESMGIKYTIAYWLTPSGKTIHRIGLQPDRETKEGEMELAVNMLRELIR